MPRSFHHSGVLPLLQSQARSAWLKTMGPLPFSCLELPDQKGGMWSPARRSSRPGPAGAFKPASPGARTNVKGYLLQRGFRNNVKLFCPFKNGKCLGRVIYYLPGCIFSLSPSRLEKYWHFRLFKQSSV